MTTVEIPELMKAMCLKDAGRKLALDVMPIPSPAAGQLLLQVLACGVCRTDLHLVDGELPNIHYPIIPGHEIVGRVVRIGSDVKGYSVGDRVGVPWLGRTCGVCAYCRRNLENLCEYAGFTGYTLNGGFAQFTVAEARFCLPIPASYTDENAAPLLCAGLIGYRAYRAAGDAQSLGLYGFGAAAHLLAQVATAQGRKVFALTRPGDDTAQQFARSLGAVWSGGSDVMPPEPLDAAIIFAPVGSLIPEALKAVRKGGRVVCAGIHMSDIPSFPYRLLWGERSISSVANLTHADGEEFMNLAAGMALHPAIEKFDLTEANVALERVRFGQLNGAAVLVNESVRV